MKRHLISLTLCLAAAVPASAAENAVTITIRGDERCIASNGTPNHSYGPFRARASLQAQSHALCVDATPIRTGRITRNVQTSGITLTGIPLRPGTAEFYDPNSRRGFSRDRTSGWRVEGMGGVLNMDPQNAHVDQQGMYHYHAVSTALVESLDSTQIGYAADGFEIHYIGSRAQSSWQLKSGTRASGPGGRHDGTYEEDYEFVAGSGNLDECNGAMVNGQYVYFATDSYPFFPRCFKGTVSADFQFQGRGGSGGDRRGPPRRPRG